jgi:hypothetical protein
MADIDVEFAQNQLLLLLGDRYQHPDGQVEFAFHSRILEFIFSYADPRVRVQL